MPKYLGCVSSESMLGQDKVYGGGASGAHLKLAHGDAIAAGKKFFAMARAGGDGHSFSFNSKPARFDVSSAGCARPCQDVQDKPCGCSDNGCSDVGDSAVPPETNNRRWAVYSV